SSPQRQSQMTKSFQLRIPCLTIKVKLSTPVCCDSNWWARTKAEDLYSSISNTPVQIRLGDPAHNVRRLLRGLLRVRRGEININLDIRTIAINVGSMSHGR